jgi:Zn-dependent protease
VTVYAESTSRRPRGAVRPSPIFLAFVAVTIIGAVLAWSDSNSVKVGQVGVFLLVFGGWIVSVCLHEFAHAFTAFRAGDHSVEAAGYLTLNPFKYAHPLLSIALPLYFIAQGGIGLPGGAVYLHPHTFRTRAQRSLASAVGPLVNVVFALILLRVAAGHVQAHDGFIALPQPNYRFWAALSFLGFLQISAAILNLLPIPGLDGYGIIEPYLNPETQRALAPVKPWGMLGLFALLYAVPAFNQRFIDAISGVYHGIGGEGNVWAVGYALFRFWNHFG